MPSTMSKEQITQALIDLHGWHVATWNGGTRIRVGPHLWVRMRPTTAWEYVQVKETAIFGPATGNLQNLKPEIRESAVELLLSIMGYS